MSADRPDWWPDNPYFESALAAGVDHWLEMYLELIPDEKERTAVSWALGNHYWNLASEAIYIALLGEIEDGPINEI